MSDQVFLFLPTKVLNEEFILNDGKHFPKITFGVTTIKEFEKLYHAVDVALETGYRSFDCSPQHMSDKNLGLSLEELLPKYNLERRDVIITSKILPKDYGRDGAREAFWRSCENLKTDYIDLFLMQWPGGFNLEFDDDQNQYLRESTWKEIVKLCSEGVVKSVGVCHFSCKHLENIRNCSSKIPAVNQVEFHPKCPQIELLKYCEDNNILMQASSFEETFHPLTLNEEVIKEVASNVKKTCTQVLLKWTVNKGVAVIPQSKSVKKIRQNFQLFDFVLEKPDMNLIGTIRTREKYLRNPVFVI